MWHQGLDGVQIKYAIASNVQTDNAWSYKFYSFIFQKHVADIAEFS